MAVIQKTNIAQTGGRPKIIPVRGSVWGDLKNVKLGKRRSGDIWSENREIEKIRELGGVFVNDIFFDIWDNDAQLLFLEGSYGSSKTTYAITRLLVHCLEEKKFKCFYGRQEKEMARQLHSNIVREIERNHWEHLFDYSKKPNGSKNIYCLENGNCFELFGCDDQDTLKGIDNPTHILVDEVNQIEFGAFGMLVTRLRTSGAKLQFIGCFNPCDVLPSHWIVKYIYAGGKTASGQVKVASDGSFSDEEMAVLDALEDLMVQSHHSTYLDNYFQNPESYYKKLVLQAGGDGERVRDYAEGRWGAQLNAQPYYKNFVYKRDVYDYDESLIVGNDEYGNPVDANDRSILYYDKYAPLIFSFDENTQPYLPALLGQRHGDELWIIDEITAAHPNNNIWDVCDVVKSTYPASLHLAGMKIRGDATAKKDSTMLEEGQNFFTMIQGLLRDYKPDLEVPDSNPNNKMRGLFINIVLKLNYGGLTIKISKKCKKFIEDLENCMEAMDASGVRTGRKDKSTKIINGKPNVQPYGHLGDCFDYLICGEFFDIYSLFQNNGVTYDPVGGGRTIRNSMENAIQFSSIRGEGRNEKGMTGNLLDMKQLQSDIDEHNGKKKLHREGNVGGAMSGRSGGKFDSYQKYTKPGTAKQHGDKVQEYSEALLEQHQKEQAEKERREALGGNIDDMSQYVKLNGHGAGEYGRGENTSLGSNEDDEDENLSFSKTSRRSRNRMI